MLDVDAKRLPLASKASTLRPPLLITGPAARNPVKVVEISVGVVGVETVCDAPPDAPPLPPPASASAPSPAPRPGKLNDEAEVAIEPVTTETGVICARTVSPSVSL